MKTCKQILSLLIACFGVVYAAQAQPPVGDANVGDVYGKAITADNAKPLAELPALLAANDSVNVKIKAVVLDVCPKKGCWINLELPDKSTVFVKMKDYGFFVPLSAIGKTVALDGVAFTEVTSVEELKHYAEDAKKSKKEIRKIKKPQSQVKFLADGIVVVK